MWKPDRRDVEITDYAIEDQKNPRPQVKVINKNTVDAKAVRLISRKHKHFYYLIQLK